MGFILQLLTAHFEEDKVEEKVSKLVDSGNRLLKAMEHEKQTEDELRTAEKSGDLDTIFRLQKKEIKLAMESIDDIRNIQFELFSLSEDEQKQLDDFIIDAKRLLLEGVPQHEERSLMEKLKHQKKTITSFFKKTKYHAG